MIDVYTGLHINIFRIWNDGNIICQQKHFKSKYILKRHETYRICETQGIYKMQKCRKRSANGTLIIAPMQRWEV